MNQATKELFNEKNKYVKIKNNNIVVNTKLDDIEKVQKELDILWYLL